MNTIRNQITSFLSPTTGDTYSGRSASAIKERKPTHARTSIALYKKKANLERQTIKYHSDYGIHDHIQVLDSPLDQTEQ